MKIASEYFGVSENNIKEMSYQIEKTYFYRILQLQIAIDEFFEALKKEIKLLVRKVCKKLGF